MIINFDIEAVYECQRKIKAAAEAVEQEGQKTAKLIELVQTGWYGAGVSEYILYLQSLHSAIQERAQNLYSISDMLLASIGAAQEADRQASEQVSPGSVCPPSESSVPDSGQTAKDVAEKTAQMFSSLISRKGKQGKN